MHRRAPSPYLTHHHPAVGPPSRRADGGHPRPILATCGGVAAAPHRLGLATENPHRTLTEATGDLMSSDDSRQRWRPFEERWPRTTGLLFGTSDVLPLLSKLVEEDNMGHRRKRTTFWRAARRISLQLYVNDFNELRIICSTKFPCQLWSGPYYCFAYLCISSAQRIRQEHFLISVPVTGDHSNNRST